MEKILIYTDKNNFSYIRYFLFTYLKINKVYEKYLSKNTFKIPYKKELKPRYIETLKKFLKKKNIVKLCFFKIEKEELVKEFKTSFSVINGRNIYNTNFNNILSFLSGEKLHEKEIVFISDNLKEISELSKKCVKKVKAISVLTEKPYLYESLKDEFLEKYGLLINVKTKKEKLKKNNKIYVNCGANRVFPENTFKNVVLIDIFKVYEGAYNEIILWAEGNLKKETKQLKTPLNLRLAEFFEDEKEVKNYKISDIKKICWQLRVNNL